MNREEAKFLVGLGKDHLKTLRNVLLINIDGIIKHWGVLMSFAGGEGVESRVDEEDYWVCMDCPTFDVNLEYRIAEYKPHPVFGYAEFMPLNNGVYYYCEIRGIAARSRWDGDADDFANLSFSSVCRTPELAKKQRIWAEERLAKAQQEQKS